MVDGLGKGWGWEREIRKEEFFFRVRNLGCYVIFIINYDFGGVYFRFWFLYLCSVVIIIVMNIY